MEENEYILIVDDNIKNLKLCAGYLKDAGYTISLALSAKDALTQIKNELPALLLLDIMMPETDGLEFCRILKKDKAFADLPVIFLTAKTQTEDLIEGFAAGGVDYIQKPFRKEELLVRVKNHINLARSKMQIEEMNKTKNKLYSMIAHDIMSPFNSIMHVIEIINRKYIEIGTPTYFELFEGLEKRTNETYLLLRNLLEWTRFQTSEIKVHQANVAIYMLVEDCIEILSANSKNKNLEVLNKIDPKAVAYCDEVMIHTVFRNLFSNAIKFTPEAGNITFTSREDDGTIFFSVKDTGVGMPEEVYEKIFVENEHFTSEGTNREKGTGLGLFLVKDFVEKNGGKLTANTKPNKGSEFIVALPVKH